VKKGKSGKTTRLVGQEVIGNASMIPVRPTPAERRKERRADDPKRTVTRTTTVNKSVEGAPATRTQERDASRKGRGTGAVKTIDKKIVIEADGTQVKKVVGRGDKENPTKKIEKKRGSKTKS
jgi:hypothetical protein